MAAKKKKVTKRKKVSKAQALQQKAGILQATGKRKTAIAKATIKPGKGVVRVNKQLLNVYTPKIARMRIQEPLMLAAENVKGLNIDVTVAGGGWQSQADAVRLAIGRALVAHEKSLKKTFLEYDRHLLVQDVRQKEACKPNDSKARAMRTKSYR